jgi:hypothetical protein
MNELQPPSAVPNAVTGNLQAGEFDLLCALVGAELAPEQIDRVANWDLSKLDWHELLNLAERHGVLPLAAHNLTDYGRGLTSEMEQALRSAHDACLRRNLWFAAELVRIMKHFAAKQVVVCPFKGPVLTQLLYRDLGSRSFSDLDFLISPTDFELGKQALAEIGYRPSAEMAPAIERHWLENGYERSFDSVTENVAAGVTQKSVVWKHLVELQWALLPHFYGVDLRVEDLQARASRIVVGEYEMPCLSPEDSLLVLCLHASKHLWTRLVWLADVEETLRTQTVDYALAFSRAKTLGITRILGVSFWLVKNVLRADLPSLAEQLIAADAEIPALGREFAGHLERGENYHFESTRYFRLVLRLRERRSDRWRYLWRLVWTPSKGDIEAIRLPEFLFPLYRIVRIGRLTRKLAGV